MRRRLGQLWRRAEDTVSDLVFWLDDSRYEYERAPAKATTVPDEKRVPAHVEGEVMDEAEVSVAAR